MSIHDKCSVGPSFRPISAGLLPSNTQRARCPGTSLRSQKRVPKRLLTIDLLKVVLIPAPARRYGPDYRPGTMPPSLVLILFH